MASSVTAIRPPPPLALLQIEPGDGRVHEMRAQVLNADGKTYEALQAAQQVCLQQMLGVVQSW